MTPSSPDYFSCYSKIRSTTETRGRNRKNPKPRWTWPEKFVWWPEARTGSGRPSSKSSWNSAASVSSWTCSMSWVRIPASAFYVFLLMLFSVKKLYKRFYIKGHLIAMNWISKVCLPNLFLFEPVSSKTAQQGVKFLLLYILSRDEVLPRGTWLRTLHHSKNHS